MPTDDELGRAATNIHNQLLCARIGQTMGYTQVDQAGFFTTGDHFDGKTKRSLSLGQELGGILGHPKGIGRHCPHGLDIEATQAFAKAG